MLGIPDRPKIRTVGVLELNAVTRQINIALEQYDRFLSKARLGVKCESHDIHRAFVNIEFGESHFAF